MVGGNRGMKWASSSQPICPEHPVNGPCGLRACLHPLLHAATMSGGQLDTDVDPAGLRTDLFGAWSKHEGRMTS